MLKVEKGKNYEVLESKYPVFHRGSVFNVTETLSDIDSQGEKVEIIHCVFLTGVNKGENVEVDYETLKGIRLIHIE